MKPLLFLLAATIAAHASAQVGIGTTTPAPSAAVDVSSDTKGFLPPRMSWAQIKAIPNPAAGLLVYDAGARAIRMWDGYEWILLSAREKGMTDAPGAFSALLATGTGSLSPQAVKVMPDKTVYVGGDVVGTGSFGSFPFSGSNSGFFARLDSNGVPTEFFRMSGNYNIIEVDCIDADASGNIYIGGNFFGTANFSTSVTPTTLTSGGSTYDGFFAKYNALGDLQWVKQVGGSAGNDYVSDLVLDGAYIFVGGDFRGAASIAGTPLTSGAVGADAFVGRFLQSTGALGTGTNGWVAQLGGASGEELFDLALYPSGVIAVGRFDGTCNFNGTSRTSAGSSDGYACFISSTGSTASVGTIGGTGTDVLSCVETDATGAHLFGGYFSGTADLHPSSTVIANYFANGTTSDAFIYKLNSAQTQLWVVRTSGTGAETIAGISTDAAGSTYAAGNFEGTVTLVTLNRPSQGSNDGFLAKISASGVPQWLHSTGGGNFDIGYAVDAQADGKVVYGAYYIQSLSRFLTLDGRVLPSGTRLYIARYEE